VVICNLRVKVEQKCLNKGFSAGRRNYKKMKQECEKKANKRVQLHMKTNAVQIQNKSAKRYDIKIF